MRWTQTTRVPWSTVAPYIGSNGGATIKVEIVPALWAVRVRIESWTLYDVETDGVGMPSETNSTDQTYPVVGFGRCEWKL
jgi:hypothetical protein